MHAIPFNYRKSYLSVAESRRWAVENPVGDPFGGPAYGEKRMPVAPVIMAVAAYAAENVVVAGLLWAGAAMSAVGQITGNKTLTMLGSIAGLAAGGVGMLDSVGAFSGVEGMTTAQVANADSVLQSLPVTSYEASTAATQNALLAEGMQASTVADVGAAATNSGGGMINTIGGSPIQAADSISQSFNSILGTDGNPINIGASPGDVVSAPAPVTNASLPGVDPAAAPGAPSAAAPEVPSVGQPQVAGAQPGDVNPVLKSVGADAPGTDGYSTLSDAELGKQISGIKDELPGYDSAGNYIGKTGSMSSNPPTPEKGMVGQMLDKAKDAGEWMNKNDKLVSMGGKILERLDPSDVEKAQAEMLKAKANGDDATAEYYRAKIAEMQRQASNANARGTNQLGTAGAISANGSAYTTGQTRNVNQLSAGR